MIIETDETINMPFMLNIDEAKLTVDATIDFKFINSLFFFIKQNVILSNLFEQAIYINSY